MKNYISRKAAEAESAMINTVLTAYEETREGKTADTVSRIIEIVGAESAGVAIATTVNAVSLHDGRISDKNREWAQSVNGAPKNEELRAVGIYGVDSWIHSAHIDNLANAWRRYERENPPTEPEQEEPTEEEKAEAEKSELLELLTASRERIEREPQRSAWNKGVNLYAFELLNTLEELAEGGYLHAEDLANWKTRKKAMLNGAQNWEEFSWGGCSLIYDPDIAERLCTPSELKKTRNGERRPNSREEWLDTQARALFQASARVSAAIATETAHREYMRQKNDRGI